MKKLHIDDPVQIALEIMKDQDKNILVVGYYETIVEVMNALIKRSDATFENGQLYPMDYDGYEEAYYLEFDGGQIYVGKCQWEEQDKYIMFKYAKAFVEEDFYDEFVESNGEDDIVVFGYVDEDEPEDDITICMDDDECGFCFCCGDDGFHHKFKYRGNKKLTKKEVKEIIDKYI